MDLPLPPLRRALATLAVGGALACAGTPPPSGPIDPPAPAPDPPAPAPEATPRIVFLVDHPPTPNRSERTIRDRLREIDPDLVLIDDEDFVPGDTVGVDLFVVSKTVEDTLVRDGLKGCPCGVFFWEENLQMLRDLATVDNDGSDGAFWHKPGSRVYVRPEAPEALRAGLAGTIEFYDREAEISYGKRQDMPPGAVLVADHGAPGGHRAIYAIERGATLADGTPAAGRRLFFGLHRDTYSYLTPEAASLFEAGLAWALGRPRGP